MQAVIRSVVLLIALGASGCKAKQIESCKKGCEEGLADSCDEGKYSGPKKECEAIKAKNLASCKKHCETPL